jgi:hypothetical protein
MSVDAALATVRAQRPSAQPNAGFMRQLARYEASFRLNCTSAHDDLVVVEDALTSGQTAGRTPNADSNSVLPPGEVAPAAPSSERHSKASKSGRECCSPPGVPRDGQDSHNPPFRQAGDMTAAAGLPIDTPSSGHVQARECEAWAEGRPSKAEDPWATGASISPEAVCGAAYMAAAHGGCDGEDDDPAPSPQSSAGTCGSSQGTPSRPAAAPSYWDIPAFSLDDCFPFSASSPERCSV